MKEKFFVVIVPITILMTGIVSAVFFYRNSIARQDCMQTGCEHLHSSPTQTAECDNACEHNHETDDACEHNHDKEEGCVEHDHTHTEHSDAPSDHEHAIHEGCGVVEVSSFELEADVAKRLGIGLTEARSQRLDTVLTLPGRFEWDPMAVRSYSAPLSGFVELKIQEPQSVKKGTLLAVINSVELREMLQNIELSEAAMRVLESGIDFLESRIALLRTNGTRNAELEMQLELKRAELQEASVKCAVFQKILTDSIPEGAVIENQLLMIRAVDDGAVKLVAVVNGEWCERGSELMRIARATGLRFRAEALFADAPKLRDGLPARVTPLTAERRESFEGVISVGYTPQSAERVMPVFADVEHMPGWVRVAMPGVLKITTEKSKSDSVIIPRESVFESGLKQLVIVADSQHPGRYSIREVRTGISNGEEIEVTAGLHAGDKVVVAGVYQLRREFAGSSGAVKQEAGHYHADGEFHVGEH